VLTEGLQDLDWITAEKWLFPGYSGVIVPLSLHMVVLNVTDMTVNANFTYHYSNGTANSTVLFVNIFSGYGNVKNLLFASGTGLKVGDPVYYYSPENIVRVQS
jgi:hypothetical protein